MTISQVPDGSLCHTEIFAKDLSETMSFYAELFGWDVRTAMNGYGMWKDQSGQEGGFCTTGRPTLDTSHYSRIPEGMLSACGRRSEILIYEK